MSILDKHEFVAIDLETTGKYPLGAEICELAMVKFNANGVVDTMSTLVRPRKGMSQVAFEVHGLSLEMLKKAPFVEEVLPKFLDFTKGSFLVGHNIPFDLGFLTYELENHIPERASEMSRANFCTSLLSLSLLPKLKSHRLMHLVEHFALKDKPNHRALQDAVTCMEVFKCLIQGVETIKDLQKIQKDNLSPLSFSPLALVKSEPKFQEVINACEEMRSFELMYSKGSKKNKWRRLNPKGLVLKQSGESFLVACDPGEIQTKRFMLSKVLNTRA